jgi:F-type H+-transporting ATPase subunit b
MHPLLRAAEDAPNPILPHTPEIIVGGIAFLLLLFLLQRFALPRFEQAFRARVDAIEGGIRRAEEAQAEAHRLLEQYRAQLAEARTEAAQIRDDARADAQRIAEEMREDALAEQRRILQRGEELLTAQRQQLVRELRAEIGSLSVQLAERLLGESLAEEISRQRSVDRFLDDLEGMSAPATVGSSGGSAGSGGSGGSAAGAGPSADGGGSTPSGRSGPRRQR